MPKKQLLSKFKIKDYNEELEKVLEEKDFSVQVKNLLLSMFYKLEIGYKDYAVVKQNIPSKEIFMESIMKIIKDKCDTIEIIKPNENDLVKLHIYKEEKKIECYQNEAIILHAILEMGDSNFKVRDEEKIIDVPIQTMLKEGYVLNIKEALTNFDGWAWNNNLDKTDEIDYFLMYEVLKIVMGPFFMAEWKRDNSDKRNYLDEVQKKSKALHKELCELCILLMCKTNEGKKTIKDNLKRLKHEYDRMEEKTEFLKEAYSQKSELQNCIKKLDKIINNTDLLKEEFINRNVKLGEGKKIFSISDLEDMLQTEIQECTEKLEENKKILLPKNYLKKMKAISDKITLVENCDIGKANNTNIYNKQIEFQECFLENLKKEINNINDKKSMVKLIYNYRYYMYLPIRKDNDIILIKDAPEIKDKVDHMFKRIITKACKMNVLPIINEDIGRNYKIIKLILDTKLVKLDDIVITFIKKKENIEIQIYDDEILDRTYTETKDNIKDFRVKFEKRIKIFT